MDDLQRAAGTAAARRQGDRAALALTSAVAVGGVLLQLVVTAGVTDGQFASLPARLVNVLCYFTIQSNLLVALSCGLLAARPDRRSAPFDVLRLTAVLCIGVTGLVYHAVLAGLQELHGAGLGADVLLHTVTPLLAVAGWLAYGPRGRVSWRVVRWCVLFPMCWVAFTLVRGPLVDFYPYPFVDVRDLGYPRVLVNVLLVAVLLLALGAGARALDRRLPR